MKPQPCPVLDSPRMRRVEARLNFVSGVALGAFLYWIGKAILVAALAGRMGGAR